MGRYDYEMGEIKNKVGRRIQGLAESKCTVFEMLGHREAG